jgi:hypothetical protein
MAEKKVYLGSQGPYLYDDTDLLDDADGDLSGEYYSGVASTGNIIATEFHGIPISSISVTDIDDPSTELNPLSASTVGGLIAVYQAVGSADDEFVMYLWDTDAAAENVPYSVDGDGGTWIAVSGKYQNGEFNVEGPISFGDSTNYASFASDGELTLHGTARVEQFVESLVPTGKGGSAPAERVTEEPYLSWTFNIGNDSHQTFEAPYSMDYTDSCKIKVHWYTSADQTDDEVQWRATWNAIPEAGGEVVNGGGTQVDSGDVNCPTQWHIIETLVGTITGNSIAQDDIIGLSIERIAIDDGTGPTISTIHVLSIEFEYYMSRLGEAT